MEKVDILMALRRANNCIKIKACKSPPKYVFSNILYSKICFSVVVGTSLFFPSFLGEGEDGVGGGVWFSVKEDFHGFLQCVFLTHKDRKENYIAVILKINSL